MHPKPMIVLLAAMAVVAPRMVMARQFEGVIKQRSINVDRQELEERGFDVSDEAMLDVSVERLLALRDDELFRQEALTVSEELIYFKGRFARMDTRDEEGEEYTILDLEEGVLRMVRPAERTYMEMTPADLEQMRDQMRDQMSAMGAMDEAGASEQPEPQETGLTKTINGLKCTAYDVETDEGITRVWVSKDDANLVTAFAQFADRMAIFNMGEDEVDPSLLIAKYGFPILVVRLPHERYEMSHIEEVVSVERQAVPDRMFVVPEGYHKMTLADMMGQQR